MAKKKGAVIEAGTIETEKIYNAHVKIKSIVESYRKVNSDVEDVTNKLRDNWVGEGRNEFESQYNQLIKKIEDFGDTLQDIYEALVEAEAGYQSGDDSLRQQYAMAMEE